MILHQPLSMREIPKTRAMIITISNKNVKFMVVGTGIVEVALPLEERIQSHVSPNLAALGLISQQQQLRNYNNHSQQQQQQQQHPPYYQKRHLRIDNNDHDTTTTNNDNNRIVLPTSFGAGQKLNHMTTTIPSKRLAIATTPFHNNISKVEPSSTTLDQPTYQHSRPQ